MNKEQKLIEDVSILDIATLTHEQITKIVCEYGLVYDTNIDYGEWQNYMVDKRTTNGIYQTPRQFAECIIEILKYNIDSYLEVGIFQGGSYLLMSNILKRKNPKCKCIGVDISDCYINQDMKNAIQGFTIGTSKNYKGVCFDLVFIDADHSYNSVKEDWENVGKYANIAMFHDVNDPSVPGVVQLWNEIKEGKQYKEFFYHSSNRRVHGIGLLFNTST
jgi:hypothetical protein